MVMQEVQRWQFLSSAALIEKGHKVILFVSKDSLTKKRALEKESR